MAFQLIYMVIADDGSVHTRVADIVDMEDFERICDPLNNAGKLYEFHLKENGTTLLKYRKDARN